MPDEVDNGVVPYFRRSDKGTPRHVVIGSPLIPTSARKKNSEMKKANFYSRVHWSKERLTKSIDHDSSIFTVYSMNARRSEYNSVSPSQPADCLTLENPSAHDKNVVEHLYSSRAKVVRFKNFSEAGVKSFNKMKAAEEVERSDNLYGWGGNWTIGLNIASAIAILVFVAPRLIPAGFFLTVVTLLLMVGVSSVILCFLGALLQDFQDTFNQKRTKKALAKIEGTGDDDELYIFSEGSLVPTFLKNVTDPQLITMVHNKIRMDHSPDEVEAWMKEVNRIVELTTSMSLQESFGSDRIPMMSESAAGVRESLEKRIKELQEQAAVEAAEKAEIARVETLAISARRENSSEFDLVEAEAVRAGTESLIAGLTMEEVVKK